MNEKFITCIAISAVMLAIYAGASFYYWRQRQREIQNAIKRIYWIREYTNIYKTTMIAISLGTLLILEKRFVRFSNTASQYFDRRWHRKMVEVLRNALAEKEKELVEMERDIEQYFNECALQRNS